MQTTSAFASSGNGLPTGQLRRISGRIMLFARPSYPLRTQQDREFCKAPAPTLGSAGHGVVRHPGLLSAPAPCPARRCGRRARAGIHRPYAMPAGRPSPRRLPDIGYAAGREPFTWARSAVTRSGRNRKLQGRQSPFASLQAAAGPQQAVGHGAPLQRCAWMLQNLLRASSLNRSTSCERRPEILLVTLISSHCVAVRQSVHCPFTSVRSTLVVPRGGIEPPTPRFSVRSLKKKFIEFNQLAGRPLQALPNCT